MLLDLRISISTGSSVPIYRQIADQVCRAALSGALRPGDQLPSVRELAAALVVNPNTVARAYADLVRDGVLEARQGKGVFAARRRPVYTKPERARRIRGFLDAFVSQALVAGCSPGEVREAVDKKLREIEEGRGSRKEGTYGTHG